MATALSSKIAVIVLRHTKLGESDAILTMLAADGSQVRGIAKGVRKSPSRFGASLEPYTVAEVQLYSKRSLPMITDAKIIESNQKCRDDLERSAAASVVAAILMLISQEGQQERRIFDLSTTALRYLGTAALEAVPLLLTAYIFKVLAMHGYRPLLDSCVCCGAGVAHEDIRWFSAVGGGVVCEVCTSKVASSAISPQTISWIAYVLQNTFETIANDTSLSAHQQQELLQFAAVWIRAQLDTRIKPLDFYLSLL